jgi:beta-galactosidase
VAVVDHEFGEGRTRLIGTMPGIGYRNHEDDGTRGFFEGLLDWAGIRPVVRPDDERLTARLHLGEHADFLWLINSSRDDVESTVRFSGERTFTKDLRVLWGSPDQVDISEADATRVRVNARDGLVIRIGR